MRIYDLKFPREFGEVVIDKSDKNVIEIPIEVNFDKLNYLDIYISIDDFCSAIQKTWLEHTGIINVIYDNGYYYEYDTVGINDIIGYAIDFDFNKMTALVKFNNLDLMNNKNYYLSYRGKIGNPYGKNKFFNIICLELRKRKENNMIDTNMKRKAIIIINGKGGVGKDTLIDFTRKEHSGVSMISAIDPIKEIAKQYGYSETDKNDKARKFLSDLKRVFIEWNELPTQYLLSHISAFLDSSDNVLFIHIREKSEIEKLKEAIVKQFQFTKFKLFTLLVKNKRIDDKTFGNASDDEVENYNYDLIYHNDKMLGAARFDWLLFFEEKVVPYMMTEDSES